MQVLPGTRRFFRWLPTFALTAALGLSVPLHAEPPEDEPGGTEKRVRAVFISAPGTAREIRELEIEDGRIRTVELGENGLQQWVRRGFLGVELLHLNADLRRHFGAPEGAGLLVARVEDDSPAADAGMRVGDVLTAIDDRPVADMPDVMHVIRHRQTGDRTRLRVIRDGRPQTLSAVLRERERAVVDLSRMVHEHRPGAATGPIVFQVDGETASEVMEQLNGFQVQRLIRSLKAREMSLLERLEALETDFRELERELETERRNR